MVAGALKEERLSPVQRCYVLEESEGEEKQDLALAEKNLHFLPKLVVQHVEYVQISYVMSTQSAARANDDSGSLSLATASSSPSSGRLASADLM